MEKDRIPILNFRWHIKGVLATGGKIDTKEKLDWLLSQGFTAIVALDPIPDEQEKAIREHCKSSFFDREEVEENEYIRGNVLIAIVNYLLANERTFVFCSAGINLSVTLVKQVLANNQSLRDWVIGFDDLSVDC